MHTFMENIHWMLRDISPFALAVAGLAMLAMVLYLLTKWKEFMMIALTAGIYVIPFMTASKLHY